jgi:hypothetical protein
VTRLEAILLGDAAPDRCGALDVVRAIPLAGQHEAIPRVAGGWVVHGWVVIEVIVRERVHQNQGRAALRVPTTHVDYRSRNGSRVVM